MKKYYELYKKLFEAIYPVHNPKFKETDLSNFVAMRGNRYDCRLNEKGTPRLMVVGRAVNGWGKSIDTSSADTYANNAITLFKNSNRFTSKDEWNMKAADSNPYSEYTTKTGEVKKYYLSTSPFWSVTRDVWYALSGEIKIDWYEDIVWNNIYKIAPSEEGNPSTNLIYAQAPTCVELLEEEINLLDPTHILLVIDKSWVSWTSRNKVMFDFMKAFNGYNCQCQTILKDRGKAIVQCAFTVENRKVLICCRPENTVREDYVKAVVNAFNNLRV